MITLPLLLEWSPCHNGAALDALVAGRISASAREIAADERITLDDRLWVVCRALWHRSESAARTFAIDSAALVSHLAGRDQDCAEHARLTEDLRRIYAIPAGAPQSEELSRWSAAWSRALSAALYASLSAAADRIMINTWNAAWYAATLSAEREATLSATREAAREAALSATREAAREAALSATREAAMQVIRLHAFWYAELHKAIDRALVALGPDADGWGAA